MDGKGRLTSTTKGTEYYGGGSCFAFLQQTWLLFDQISPWSERAAESDFDDAMSRLFDSPLPEQQPRALDILLPEPLLTTSELFDVVFGRAYPLLQFLHEPTFQQHKDRICYLDPMDFEESDHDFLPLFHSVTALGYLFHQKMHEKHGCEGAVNQAWANSSPSSSPSLTVSLGRVTSSPHNGW